MVPCDRKKEFTIIIIIDDDFEELEKGTEAITSAIKGSKVRLMKNSQLEFMVHIMFWHKQTQLITMHSYDFQISVVQS